MATLQELQARQQELAAQIAELQEQQEHIAAQIAEHEQVKPDDAVLSKEDAYDLAFADYRKKLQATDDFFSFEITEYTDGCGTILVWDKKIYYSDHPAVIVGDKVSAKKLSSSGYSKKRTPFQGKRLLIK